MFRNRYPQVAFKQSGKTISWNLHDRDVKNHFTIIPGKEIIHIGNNVGKIVIDGKFCVNIAKFKDDIIESVMSIPDGYLQNLNTDTSLQNNFKIAINEIYEDRVHAQVMLMNLVE